MKAYGITKYRNLKGEIAEQEWISISDIGRSFGGVTLTARKLYGYRRCICQNYSKNIRLYGSEEM